MTSPIFNKLAPQEFLYKPRVRYGEPNFVVRLGPFPVAMISRTLESIGVVDYHQLLIVGNEAAEEIYFVTAESNPVEKPRRFHFCSFDPQRHATMGSSKLLLLTPVFFCAACRMVREYLGLDFAAAPLTGPEIQGLELLPQLCEHYVPDWREHSRWLVEFIRDGLPDSHPARAGLDTALAAEPDF